PGFIRAAYLTDEGIISLAASTMRRPLGGPTLGAGPPLRARVSLDRHATYIVAARSPEPHDRRVTQHQHRLAASPPPGGPRRQQLPHPMTLRQIARRGLVLHPQAPGRPGHPCCALDG